MSAFSPMTRRVKNKPIERGIPALENVTRIPEAAPRWRAGTAFMMEEVFGEAKSPLAIPEKKRTTAKGQYEKSGGKAIITANIAADSTMPAVANNRAPKWSESIAERGPVTTNPSIHGIMQIPAHRGVTVK